MKTNTFDVMTSQEDPTDIHIHMDSLVSSQIMTDDPFYVQHLLEEATSLATTKIWGLPPSMASHVSYEISRERYIEDNHWSYFFANWSKSHNPKTEAYRAMEDNLSGFMKTIVNMPPMHKLEFPIKTRISHMVE